MHIYKYVYTYKSIKLIRIAIQVLVDLLNEFEIDPDKTQLLSTFLFSDNGLYEWNTSPDCYLHHIMNYEQLARHFLLPFFGFAPPVSAFQNFPN